MSCKPTETAVIAGVFAARTSAIKVDLADTADIVLGDIPPPGCDGVPSGNLDLHGVVAWRCKMQNNALLKSKAKRVSRWLPCRRGSFALRCITTSGF